PCPGTPPGRREAPGAGASFCDRLDPAELAGLAAGSSPRPSAGGTPAGISLALESAAYRQAIEDAARNRDDATVAAVQRGRLKAALSLAREMTLDAWRAAGAPTLAAIATAPGQVRTWPNPPPPEPVPSF